MSHLDFNGVNTLIDPSLETWRELLLNLESERLSQDQVIASVRFDGDEVTHFRGDAVLDLRLQSIEEIRVEAVATKEMLRNAVRESEGYLASLETSMVDVAETFRNGRAEQANLKLHHVLAGVKMLVALLRGIELSFPAATHIEAGSVEQALLQMGATLNDLITAQTEKDWTLVSDILEYELLAHLSNFQSVLTGFNQALGRGQ